MDLKQPVIFTTSIQNFQDIVMLLIQCYEVQPLSCTLELARMFFIMYGNEPQPMSGVMQSFLKHIIVRTMKQMAATGNPSDFAELIASFFQVNGQF